MTRATTLAVFACLVIFTGALPASGQQTRLTDEQIASARAEVPVLMEVLELKPGMAVGDVGAGFQRLDNDPRVRWGLAGACSQTTSAPRNSRRCATA